MEGLGVLVGSGNKSFNGGAEFILVCEVSSTQCFARQETEPDFDLIEPTGGCRCEVKLNPAVVLLEPVGVFLVGGVVIQNDMNVFIGRQLGNDLIPEASKVFALFLFRGLGMYLSAGDFQRRTDLASRSVCRCFSWLAPP